MIRNMFLLTLILGLGATTSLVQGGEESAQDLIKQANAALAAGKPDDALSLANKAVAKAPKEPQVYFFRGSLHYALAKNPQAVADFTKVIQLDDQLADAYQQRGLAHFKVGKIKESIADFDKHLEFKPERTASHWQRGISFYYAGRYADGMKQFEGYQTVDDADVENAVWRFLCQAKKDGLEKARKDMLKIGRDKRVPMMEVYDMFLGKLKPDDVLAAARDGEPAKELLNRQLFYAHLYLGLYFDAVSDRQRALDHLNKASDQHKIGHYMWDVARVHRDILLAAGDKGK